MTIRVVSLIADHPRAGKSTVADTLQMLVPNSKVLPMAKGVKAMADGLLTSVGIHGPRLRWCQHQGKEDIIPELGISYRLLCQRTGTELGRHQFGDDFWINIWLKQIKSWEDEGRTELVIVDDQRFINEVKATRKLGGVIWRIKRPEMESFYAPSTVTKHASEGALANYPVDWTILNVGDVPALAKAAISAWQALTQEVAA